MLTTFQLDVGGVSLAVYTQGSADNPPLLLVHGYPDDHRVWDSVAQELERDFLVIRYDVRGAGASDAPPATTAYQLEILAADLNAVLDAVSPGRSVHLVAHDWGSIQSWEVVTDSDLSRRIASFTSISGPCLDHMGFWLRSRFRPPSRLHWMQLLGQLLRSWYVILFHLPGTGLAWRLGMSRAWPWLLQRTEHVTASGRTGQARDGVNGVRLYRANFLRRLLRPSERFTDVPVQLIIPANDLFVSPHLYDDLHRWVPHLSVHQMTAGHWLPLSQPQLLAERICRFALMINASETGAKPACDVDISQASTPQSVSV